jgi:hypothetical protein
MRIATLAVIAAVAAVAAGARIETDFVPADQIQGEPWTFEFDFRLPQRIIVPDETGVDKAYWAIVYTVTNTGRTGREFVPQAIMFTDSGKAAYDGVYPDVVEQVRKKYRLSELKNSIQMMGELRAGEDEAQIGVFVFPEQDLKMDRFKVFVTGLSGEFIVRQMPPAAQGGEPRDIVLRKTLQLEFAFPGDEFEVQRDKVYLAGQKFIWR